MSELVLALVSGGVGAAIAGGIMGLITYKVKRHDEKTDKQNGRCAIQTTAIQYLMLHAIRDECEKHIVRRYISYEDRRMLHKWHDLYHKKLGGNGDADLLMAAVDELPLRITEEE